MAGNMDVWAVVEHEKPLEKLQQPIPEPKGTEVLIKVTHCGVCHSDLHFWEGWYDLGGGKRFNIGDRGVKLPRAIGHEILGDIEKVGPDAGSLPVGARRVIYPWVGCGNCRRCDEEQDNLCAAQQSLGVLTNGGFASYVIVPHPKYLVDPGDVDPAVACTFGCSGITTLSAVTKVMPMGQEEPCVLIGAGGLGLAAISMLHAMGHKNVVSVDINAEKLEAAKKVGASATVDISDGDAAKKIMAATGGPVLGVIDFVNNSKTAPVCLAITAKGAKWVQVGVMGGEITMSLVANIFKGLTILSNVTGNPQHLRDVTKMAREGKLAPLPVEKISWDEANPALEKLRDGKVTGRLIMVKS